MITYLLDNTKIVLEEQYSEGRRSWYKYTFHDNETGVIFSGKEYSPSPLWSSPKRIALGCLEFITLSPGDTEPEHFNNYIPEQLEWSRSIRCNSLALLVMLEIEKLEKKLRTQSEHRMTNL